jgi:inorganic pyrophosphatase
VAPHLLTEIAHFFGTYKELEKKKVGVKGWKNVDAALEIIRESQERYQRENGTGEY